MPDLNQKGFLRQVSSGTAGRDTPDGDIGPLVVTGANGAPLPVTGASSSSPAFARIKTKNFLDTEEVRYDIPASLVSADIYTGVATDGTATSAPSWTVVRTRFDSSGNPTREQIRSNVAWDNRAAASW